MTQAILLDQTGGPEVLRPGEIDLPPLGPSDVRLRQAAIGVNFLDVYLRKGVYPLPAFPAVLGVEGAGVVDAVGEAVEHLRPGDRVAYGGPPLGGYAAERVMPAARLAPLPQAVGFETAAAGLFLGLTAHMLLFRVWRTEPGDWILVHAGAGGLGQVLTRWARDLGAHVIATVGSEAKIAAAQAAGAEHVLLHGDPDLAGQVRALSGGGVQAACDGIGGSLLRTTLDCVRPFGIAASLGQAAGPIPDVSVEELGPRRAISLARPSVMAYAANPAVYAPAAAAVLARLAQGAPVQIAGAYPLAEAARAHADLEGGRTVGSVLLTP